MIIRRVKRDHQTEKIVTEIETKGRRTGTGIVTEIGTETGSVTETESEIGTAKLPTLPLI